MYRILKENQNQGINEQISVDSKDNKSNEIILVNNNNIINSFNSDPKINDRNKN